MSDSAIRPAHPSLAERMRSFSSSWYALVGGFLWGLFEGTFFFIVPDVFITLVGLFRLRSGLAAMAASIVGSLLSAAVIYLLVASLGGLTVVHLVESVPEISEEMVIDVSEQLSEFGLSALLVAPLRGTPYKVYSVQAAVQDMPLGPFLLWSIPSRLERLLPTILFAGLLGVVFRNSVQRHTWIWLGIHFSIWVAIYAFYWNTV